MKASQLDLVVKNLPANAGDKRDTGLNSGSTRSPGEKKWLPIPVFLSGKSHGQRCLNAQILQARLQQYVNHELPDVQAGFRKGRGTRHADIHWIIEKSKRVPEKHLFLLY